MPERIYITKLKLKLWLNKKERVVNAVYRLRCVFLLLRHPRRMPVLYIAVAGS